MIKVRIIILATLAICSMFLASGVIKFSSAYSSQSQDQWVARPFHYAELATSYAIAGYSPSQIQAAYNLPSTGGAGATIAIIDAYDAPTILDDLTIFSNQYGLPPPTSENFEIHRMATSLATDSGWAQETALDVEWAHAIAPQAKILLVQARSPSLNNLLAAVDYARGRSDVVAVSMSWGDDEFSSEKSYDYHFTSAYGAVFFISSGDNGAGVMWPSSSINVVSVGGTTLSLNSDGSSFSETAWSGSGGGISAYETIPAFQATYGISGNRRATPDVSYDANPSTGFAVYSNSNWYKIGGTSAGAPQWAAIHALGRSASNSNFYPKAKSSSNAFYFRDITVGTNGRYSAGVGYDYVTGLGSPLTTNFVSSATAANFVTFIPAGQSSPLTSTNQFTVNYVLNGIQQTAYASNGTLTLNTDLNTYLTIAGLSSGSTSQEKWVLNSENNPVTGANMTLYYYDLVAQTTSYTIDGGGNPPNPTLTYSTAPLAASGQQATQTVNINLIQSPQTIWALKGTDISVTNPISATSTEQWITQSNSTHVQSAVSLNFIYYHQYLLVVTGGQISSQWYNSSTVAQLSVPTILGRDSDTGQRLTSYSVDSGSPTQVQPTLGTENISVVMNSSHQLQLNLVPQYQVALDSSAAKALSSITKPTIEEDNYWYDAGTVVTATFDYSWNATSNSRLNAVGYTVGQGIATPLQRHGNGTFPIKIEITKPTTFAISSVTQFELSVSGGKNISFSEASPSGDDFFDSGTTVSTTTQNIWNQSDPNSRQRLVFYTLDGSTVPVSETQTETFTTTPITFNKAHELTFNSVTQYLISFRFTDHSGNNPITPSHFDLETDNSNVADVPQFSIWLDNGTTFQIHSIIWQNSDVKPSQQTTYVANAPLNQTVQCNIFNATLTTKDYLNIPVSGAQVTVTLANQTSIQAVTASDGTVNLPMIPLETYTATISYFGTSTTVAGNASTQSNATAKIFTSLPTFGLIAAIIIVIVAVAAISVRRRHGPTKTASLPEA